MCLIENIPYGVCLLSSHTETLVPLYSQGTHSGNLRFFSGTNVLFAGTHHGASPRAAAPRCPVPQQLGSLPPSCPLLSTWEFEKWGEKRIPRDSALPHDFKTGSVGLEMTFPQGTAAAKGFWILFYLHTEWRPGTAASPNTDPSGQHQLDQSHQTLVPML